METKFVSAGELDDYLNKTNYLGAKQSHLFHSSNSFSTFIHINKTTNKICISYFK